MQEPRGPVAIPAPYGPTGTFLSSLKHNDLVRLRRLVKRVHMQNYPSHLMTDREADRIIESFGPKVAEQQLKRAVDAKLA